MEEQQPSLKVSAIIVSWNSAPALRRCLESLERSEDRENLEIIVIDCGSRDESPRLDTEFPKVNLLRLPRNFGIVKALNIGMRTASGDFFLFLRPEMEVLPDTAGKLASCLEASKDAVAVSPLLAAPDGQVLSRVRSLATPPELYQAWRDGDFPDWTPPKLDADFVAVEFQKGAAFLARGNFLKGMRYIDERYGNSWWDLEIAHQIRRASKKTLLLRDVRVTVHPAEDYSERLDSSARALISADRALCAATFSGKHYGWGAGLRFRFAATFHALLQVLLALVRFRDASYHFSRFSYLLSGQKFDGSQRFF